MAYEARRNDDENKEQEEAQSNAANQKATKAGLKAVSNTGGWWGAAAKAVDKADDITGGKITELAGKGLTKANKVAPLGNTVQKATNKVANSKLADKAYDAYTSKSGGGAANAAGKAAKAKEGVDKAKEAGEKAKQAKEAGEKAKEAKEAGEKAKKGGEQAKSLPSSGDDKPKDNASSDKSGSTTTVGIFAAGGLLPVVMAISPLFLIVLFFIPLLSFINNFSDYEDAFGISQVAGLETGGLDGTISDEHQLKFYERIMEVKEEYAEDGKTVDPLLVVSVFHALNTYSAKISYDDMTKSRIEDIADAMFNDKGVYDKNIFKDNLKNDIIPTYIPFADDESRDRIINEVFNYINRYYVLIGKAAGCSSVGSCNYDIKGFYIEGTNFKKEMSVNNIYVRLMQCGSYNGHDAGGQWGEPLEGEELIPFEKYILGVAYQEIGASAPAEAFKAQMIASRSFILARPTQMGSATSWRKLEQENGNWILQVASCTADQVYCDPDKGCSAENGDGQWKQVYSGTDHGRMIQGPLPQDSPARRYAAEVQGETLVNDQGNIILTDYDNTETTEFIKLANEGLDYKQILMQVYSNKYPSAGSVDMAKASCNTCASTSDSTGWKQYEGDWAVTQIGESGQTIKQIGCLVTSLAIQIARSGVETNIADFNPGTFVEALNRIGAFSEGGALLDYSSVSRVVPDFKYQGYADVKGMERSEKVSKIQSIVNQPGVYAIAEVKGDTGQHWVAIDRVEGDTIYMFDPGSTNTDMWGTYEWYNTSRIVYYKVG